MIDGLPWHLVVKIDREEAFSELHIELVMLGVTLFFAMISILSVVVLRYQWKIRQQLMLDQRDLAEASAGEREQQVVDLLDSTAEGVIGVDLKGMISFANQAALKLLGYQCAESLVGQALHQLLHYQHSSDSPYLAHDDPRIQKILSGTKLHSDKDVLWRLDGTSFSAEYWPHPIMRENDLVGAVMTFVDITERKQMELQLNKLVQVVEQNPNSIVITNLEAEIEYVNDSFLKTTGYTHQETILQNPRILQSGKTSSSTFDAMWNALSHGKSWKGELCNKKKDGSEFVEFVNILPIYQANGIVSHYASIKEDVTEKIRLGNELDKHRHHLEELVNERTHALAQQTEVALQLRARAEAAVEQKTKYLERVQQSEERFRHIVETSTDFIWEVDLNCLYTYVSPFVETLLGYKQQAVIGKNLYDFMSDSGTNRIAPLFQNHIDNKQSFKNLEKICIHKDGSEVLLLTSGVPIVDREGVLKGYRGLDRDITEEKRIAIQLEESKDQLTLALESAGLGLWDWRPQDDILVTNDIFLTMLGFLPDAFPQSTERWANLVHPDDLEPTLAILQPYLDGDDGEYQSEHRLLTVDNEWKWILDVGRVIERDKEGKALRFIGVHIDITKLKEAEKMAEAANQSKSDFLANMSHEIRTPMNAVLGLTYLLGETILDNKQRNFVDKISASGKSLLGIINEILDFSKIEAGYMELEQTAFSLAELLNNISIIIQPNMDMNKAMLTVSHLPAGIDVLLGDALRLQQVLINFLSNAAKFSEHGEVRLDVSQLGAKVESGQEKSERVHLRFSVKDTGIGIPIDKQAEIFNAFSQEDVSTTRKYGGTGLGLAICSRLVGLMKGKIGVNSEPGMGSEFWIELPFKQSSASFLPNSQQPLTSGIHRIDNLHILVVDDSEINREVVKNILELREARVSLANDGQQAVDFLKAKADEVDLVLMDVQMPVMDGFQATRIIRQDLALDLPIIALTAGVFKEQEESCMASGMTGFLPKPIDVDKLFAVIKKFVSVKSNAKNNPSILFSDRQSLSTTTPSRLPGLNIAEGLKIWQVEASYQKYLANFIVSYGLINTEILSHLNAKEYDEVSSITHKLKGVASNLGMPDLSNLAGQLDKNIKSEEQVQTLFDAADRLTNELQQALVSIKHYLSISPQTVSEQQEQNTGFADPENLKVKLVELLAALETDNPNDAQPLLAALKEESTSDYTQLVEQAVDGFDFKRAKIETQNMLKALETG